jgi:beta-glucosidase
VSHHTPAHSGSFLTIAPVQGRNQETISEDPLLAGEHGAQVSLGLQYDLDGGGAVPPRGQPTSGEFMAVATLKHVVAYSLEQWSPDGNWTEDVYSRNMFNAVVSPYDMEDTYTQPFKRAIQKGGAAGVMYACNMVNGVPAVASADLAGRLRSWGFTGYRTTDGGGIG